MEWMLSIDVRRDGTAEMYFRFDERECKSPEEVFHLFHSKGWSQIGRGEFETRVPYHNVFSSIALADAYYKVHGMNGKMMDVLKKEQEQIIKERNYANLEKSINTAYHSNGHAEVADALCELLSTTEVMHDNEFKHPSDDFD